MAVTTQAPPLRSSVPPKRGGCLTIWLALSILGGVVVILVTVLSLTSGFFDVSILPSALAGIALAIAALAMWKWKKWGVYLYVGVSVLLLVTSLLATVMVAGMSDLGYILADVASWFVSMGIFYALVKPKWPYFT